MISEPRLIASIAGSVYGPDARTYSGEVYGVDGDKRKLRPEVAVASDGVGLSIVDIRAASTVVSYVVSPQTEFFGCLTSVRNRRHRDGAVQRLTACAIRAPRPQIICFIERYGRDDHVETYTRDFEFEDDAIVNLEVQVGEGNLDRCPQFQLLVVRASGLVQCFSHSLNEELWSTTLLPTREVGSEYAFEIRQAAWIPMAKFGKLILKDRQDLMAHIDLLERSNFSGLPLLFAVSNESRSLLISIYHLGYGSPLSNTPRASPAISLISSQSLPLGSSDDIANPEIHLDFSRAMLALSSEKSVSVFRIYNFLPYLQHSIVLNAAHVCSLQMSASNTAITISSNILHLIDLEYNSILASQDLSLLGRNMVGDDLKTGSHPTGQQTSASILCFIRRLRLIVVLRDRQVFACNLQDDVLSQRNPRKRKRDGHLCGSLSKGIARLPVPCSISPATASRSEDAAWEQKRRLLDKTFDSGALDRFTEIILQELTSSVSSGSQTSNPMSFWAVNSRLDPNPSKVDYLMTRIFLLDRDVKEARPEQPGGCDLRIPFLPKEIRRWLITRGLFARDHIQASLRREGVLHIHERISSDGLVKALIKRDPQLNSVASILTDASRFDSKELVILLKTCLAFTNTAEPSDDAKLITNGVEWTIEHPDAQNVDGQMDKLNAVSRGSHGEERHASLRNLFDTLLIRLHAQTPAKVTIALREVLSKKDLQGLMHTIRLRLASGGWLTPYRDVTDAAPDLDSSSGDAAPLVSLLDCLLNVIGMSGWTVAASMSEELEGVSKAIGYMKAEILAAIDGIVDAKRLDGALDQLLLYEKRTRGNGGSRSQTQQVLQAQNPLLPVGIPKPIDLISPTRVGAGGRPLKRTARDIGRLKSRAVGKYSLESIKV